MRRPPGGCLSASVDRAPVLLVGGRVRRTVRHRAGSGGARLVGRDRRRSRGAIEPPPSASLPRGGRRSIQGRSLRSCPSSACAGHIGSSHRGSRHTGARPRVGRGPFRRDRRHRYSASRFLLADACALAGVAVVHAAAIRWNATVLTVGASARPCYRCLFEEPPAEGAPDCATAGVAGPVCGVSGAIAADRALRLLAGDTTAASVMVTFDGLRDRLRAIPIPPRRTCPLCGERRTIRVMDAPRPDAASPGEAHRGDTMEIIVRIPTPLRTLTGGIDEVTATGATVGDVIDDLETRHAGMKNRLRRQGRASLHQSVRRR